MLAQGTSCQNFFSRPLYVHEIFLARWSCARIFFLCICTCRIFFFKITQPPPSEVKWSAPYVSRFLLLTYKTESYLNLQCKISSYTSRSRLKTRASFQSSLTIYCQSSNQTKDTLLAYRNKTKLTLDVQQVSFGHNFPFIQLSKVLRLITFKRRSMCSMLASY